VNRPLLAAGGAWDREATRLRAERDRAAYALVSTVGDIILFQEALTLDEILEDLTLARSAFLHADAAVKQFHTSQPKKEHSNGKRTSAA
jgi:hypothetical protein